MMIDYIFLIATFAISMYFFYKLKTQKNHKGLNGVSAGAFLVIFVYKSAPIVAMYAKNLLLK